MISRRKPDGKYAWVVAASVFLSMVFCYSAMANGVLFIALSEEYPHYPSATLVAMFSTESLIEGLTGLTTGALIQRYGCRVLAVSSSLIGTVGYILSHFAPSPTFLYFTYGILLGVSYGLTDSVYDVIIQQSFIQKRTLAASVGKAGWGICTFMYPPLCQLLIDIYGWRGTYIIWAGFFLQSLPFSMLLLPPDAMQDPNITINSKVSTCKIHDEESKPTRYQTCTCSSVEECSVSKEHRLPLAHTNKLSRDRTLLCHRSRKDVTMTQQTSSILTSNGFEDGSLDRTRTEENMESGFPKAIGLFNASEEIENESPSYHKLQAAFVLDDASVSSKSKAYSVSCCSTTCTEKMTRFLRTIFDIKLLKEPVFISLAIFRTSSFLVRTIPDFFLPSLAVSHGVHKRAAALLISIQAVSQTVAGLLAGYVGDVNCVSRLWFCAAWSIMSGLVMIAMLLATDYLYILIYSVVFGICLGCFTAVEDPLGVDLIGISRYPHCVGFINFLQGIFFVLLAMICGLIVDATGTFHLPYPILGGLHIASAILLLWITKGRRCSIFQQDEIF